MASSSWVPKWPDLPPEVLGLVIARLPNPADRARFRAACRSWHTAARQHARPQMPWVVLGDGYVFPPSGGRSHRLPSFPDDGICVGYTDGWLALALGDTYECGHALKHRLRSFLLHNTFSGKSVPLTALDGVVVHETCRIRKFLMRSTPDDFIAVVTDKVDYPLVVFREGRGAWVPPEPRKSRCKHIIDVAFLGDTLYAITRTEDLIPLDLELDGNGAPVVTVGRRVIKQSTGYDDHSHDDHDDEDENDSDEEEAEEEDSDDEATPTDEEEEVDEEEDGQDSDGDETTTDDDDDDEASTEESDIGHNLRSSLERGSDHETGEVIMTSRHLIESRGKLLLVRQHKQSPLSSPSFTRRVELLEADINTGTWVPLPVDNGLGGDRALFISTYFSKFVSAPRGEVEADVVYCINTGEAFHFKSQTSSQSRFCKPSQGMTWLFPPEMVL